MIHQPYYHQYTIDEIKEFIDKGIINGGMIPKLECCVEALIKELKMFI